MVFYKYAGNSGIKILKDLRLKITPPNEFNDPFELTPRSKFTITLAEMVDRANTSPDQYRGVFEDLKKDGYRYTFEHFIAELPNALPAKFGQFRKRMREELVKNDMKSVNEASAFFGILCVSKIASNIPMWSHYSNDHKGIVIGLDVTNIGNAFGPFRNVKYHKFRRGVDPWLAPTNPEWFKQRMDAFFVKSREWCYEKEYRRVFQLKNLIPANLGKKGKCHYFFDLCGSDIREVIFGCRVNKAYESRIRAELARRPKTFGHVKLFRCKRHDSRFELEIIPT